IGPEKPDDFDEMWKEIRAGEFPQHACLHAICPTVFDPLQAPSGKHAASLFMPVPFQLKGKKPEDWVKLKNGFMESVLKIWRRYATNLTDANIEMKVAMDPFYISGRWPNMRRGSVWVARKIPKQMGKNRPIEELAGYRTPIEGLYQVGVATHPADGVVIGAGHNGMICSAYLAKCGQKIMVVEKNMEVGGGLDSHEDRNYPGFWHNIHSVFHRGLTMLPWFKDLELENFGIHYYRPDPGVVHHFLDKTYLGWFADVKRTAESIARFSKKDAA